MSIVLQDSKEKSNSVHTLCPHVLEDSKEKTSSVHRLCTHVLEDSEEKTSSVHTLCTHVLEDSEESRYYRNFLSWWKLRFPSEETERSDKMTAGSGDESESAKVFDYKSKKFVASCKEEKVDT